MSLEILTKEDLEKFKVEMLEAITEEVSKIKQNESGDKYLRTKEVKAMLGVSDGSLYNLRVKGLPFIRLGDSIYLYSKKDLIRYLEEHKIDYSKDQI